MQNCGPLELRSVNDADRGVLAADTDRSGQQISIVFDRNTVVITPYLVSFSTENTQIVYHRTMNGFLASVLVYSHQRNSNDRKETNEFPIDLYRDLNAIHRFAEKGDIAESQRRS